MLSIALWILIAAVPLLIVGLAFEAEARSWIESLASAPAALLLLSCGLLASDIVLPIPSSFVCTVCGQSVSWLSATSVCGIGMILGSVIGFALARCWGRRLALRFSSAADVAMLDRFVAEKGVWSLILLRPLPILAEAGILVCGVHRLPWVSFLCATSISSFVFAGVFTALGKLSATGSWSTAAWILSVVLPLAMMIAIRPWLAQRSIDETK